MGQEHIHAQGTHHRPSLLASLPSRDVDEFVGAPKLRHNLPEAISVESLTSLSEINLDTSILLAVLILEWPHSKYYIHSAPALYEFREET